MEMAPRTKPRRNYVLAVTEEGTGRREWERGAGEGQGKGRGRAGEGQGKGRGRTGERVNIYSTLLANCASVQTHQRYGKVRDNTIRASHCEIS